MATRDLTRRFAELRVLRHGAVGMETKRPGDTFSESGLLDVSVMDGTGLLQCANSVATRKCRRCSRCSVERSSPNRVQTALHWGIATPVESNSTIQQFGRVLRRKTLGDVVAAAAFLLL